jgi:glutamate synthase (NADPH/NADH) small chain
MPGYDHEWKAGKVENCTALWQTQPVRFEGDGRLQRAICVAYDDNKKPIADSEHVVDCDLVLLAIGQNKLGELVAPLDGVQVSWGVIQVDENQSTGRPGVWAGGDCSNGAKEVVNAAAEGKAAAIAIDEFLTGDN